jgi:hypothetical protein
MSTGVKAAKMALGRRRKPFAAGENFFPNSDWSNRGVEAAFAADANVPVGEGRRAP